MNERTFRPPSRQTDRPTAPCHLLHLIGLDLSSLHVLMMASIRIFFSQTLTSLSNNKERSIARIYATPVTFDLFAMTRFVQRGMLISEEL